MIKKTLKLVALALLFAPNLSFSNPDTNLKPIHAISMQGSPKYDADFKHFDHVNPNAKKGGELKLASFGAFDTLNPFTVKGIPAVGISYIYDTLLASSKDEPFTEYGLTAKSMIMPEDRSYIEFTLNENAKFHDGKPITPEDVIFSFNTIKEKGSPIYNSYYKDVTSIKSTGENKVRFDFTKGINNRELPLIIGQLPILPKHFYKGKDFAKTTLEIPLGSGPYKVDKFEPGRYISYVRVDDYWGKDLPVNVGRYNFDKVRYDYYRDTTVAMQALKSGAYDLRVENEAKKWATAYNDDEKQGFFSKLFGKKDKKTTPKLIKREFPHQNPSGIQAFVLNLRKDIFKDRELRKALAYAFDYEWTNKNLFYDSYKRTRSYFDNSEMAASGLPSAKEIEILEKYRDDIPPEVFNQEYNPPSTKGEGSIRKNLEAASQILKDAGYKMEQGILKDKDGKAITFEIMFDSGSAPTWERVTLPFIGNLKRLGINATIRVVDINQYKNRLDNFDFDMITNIWGVSSSPGNEQRYFWGSKSASEKGSLNYAGIENKVVDELIERLINSKDREDLVINIKALDRVLQWNYYLIPHWHLPATRVVYADKFSMLNTPKNGVDLMSWWIKE